MTRRMQAALVAMVGLFVALYLTLYKLGYIGTLACKVGSCETVQTSRWATLLGLPVAAWGAAFYAVALGAALAGLKAALLDSRRLAGLMTMMTGVGTLFSLWLTYLELFVIRAVCMYCVISASLVTLLFVIWLLDLRAVTALQDDRMRHAMAQLRDTGYGQGMKRTPEMTAQAVTKDPK